MSRRRILLGVLVFAALAAAVTLWRSSRFPPDTTPEGAYLRVAHGVGRGETAVLFSYLEDEAQHATFTIVDYRKRALAAVLESYPEPERTRMADQIRVVAALEGGPALWEMMARERGWVSELRRDMSGIATIETVGERATVVTARGTRYAFRRRENGMWGMTLFTAELVSEAERAARDFEVVERAAADYRAAAARDQERAE